MSRIELVPDLEHCIQTRARQEYGAAMSRLMAGDQSPDLERQVELLKSFLEEADFGRLRRESEAHLAQGRQVKFILDGAGGPGGWSVRMTAGDQ